MGNTTTTARRDLQSLIAAVNPWQSIDNDDRYMRAHGVILEQAREIELAGTVVVVGEPAAGKSALISRLVFNVFYTDEHTKTDPPRFVEATGKKKPGGSSRPRTANPSHAAAENTEPAVFFDQSVQRPVAEEDYTLTLVPTPNASTPSSPVKIYETTILSIESMRKQTTLMDSSTDQQRGIGIVLVYDCTSIDSLTSIEAQWLCFCSQPSVSMQSNGHVVDQASGLLFVPVLVGCKSDLPSSRQVSSFEAWQSAVRLNVPHVQTSALLPSNVQRLFCLLCSELLCSSQHRPTSQPSTRYLVEAVKDGDLARITQLLAYGALGDEQSVDGRSALSLAVRANARDIVQCLVTEGRANVNQRDLLDGRTPLLHAVLADERVNASMVELLLRLGADPNLLSLNDEWCATPVSSFNVIADDVDAPRIRGTSSLYQLLRRWPACIPATVHSPLSLSVGRGHSLEAVECLLDARARHQLDPVAHLSPFLTAFTSPFATEQHHPSHSRLLRLCCEKLLVNGSLTVTEGFLIFFADYARCCGIQCELRSLQPSLLALAVATAVSLRPNSECRAWKTLEWLLANRIVSPNDVSAVVLAVDRSRIDVLELLAAHGSQLNSLLLPGTRTTPLLNAILRRDDTIVDFLASHSVPRLIDLCHRQINRTFFPCKTTV